MSYRLLLLKESATGEQRVALIPEDVKKLIDTGHTVSVESGAGELAGFTDDHYQNIGANIVQNQNDYPSFFSNKDILIRAKRPDRTREKLEALAFREGQILIGALDPFLKDGHIDEYRQARIEAYSIDQMELEKNDKMNLLAQMSDITGRLAVLDAIRSFNQPTPPHRILIVGAGTAGLSALHQALEEKLQIDILVTRQDVADNLNQIEGVSASIISKSASIEAQQSFVLEKAKQADLIITSARIAGQTAPLLFPSHTLDSLSKGTVIIDLALSEGGNVQGSQHDKQLILGNEVTVKNVSGYPKQFPHKASIAWSKATLLFLMLLMNDPNHTSAKEAKINY